NITYNNIQYNYFILNKINMNKKTWVGGWRDFEPLGHYIGKIEANNNLGKIYNDNIVYIYLHSN
ncbi:MAG: hypothetical protein WA144_06030, partial [Candidatus Methanoperedens sp.]